MHSSFPPFGPRTRHSLITTFVETACTRDEKLRNAMKAKTASTTNADATNTRDDRVGWRGLIRRIQSSFDLNFFQLSAQFTRNTGGYIEAGRLNVCCLLSGSYG